MKEEFIAVPVAKKETEKAPVQWASNALVGVPTVGGIKSALGDFAYGGGGGLVYLLSESIFGNGFIGGLLGAILSGSVIKGVKGEILATMLGFMAVAGLNGGGASAAQTSTGGAVVV